MNPIPACPGHRGVETRLLPCPCRSPLPVLFHPTSPQPRGCNTPWGLSALQEQDLLGSRSQPASVLSVAPSQRTPSSTPRATASFLSAPSSCSPSPLSNLSLSSSPLASPPAWWHLQMSQAAHAPSHGLLMETRARLRPRTDPCAHHWGMEQLHPFILYFYCIFQVFSRFHPAA